MNQFDEFSNNRNPQQQTQQRGSNTMNHDEELDFNAVINVDNKPRVLLPKGEYNFTVLNYKQSEYTQKETNQVRKRVIITLGINYQGEEVQIEESIPLLKSMEWKFGSFFTSIGDRRSGEPFQMDWNKVNGKIGRCSIKHETYINKMKEEAVSSKVDRFLEPKDNTQVTKPSFQQQAISHNLSVVAHTGVVADKPWEDNF